MTTNDIGRSLERLHALFMADYTKESLGQLLMFKLSQTIANEVSDRDNFNDIVFNLLVKARREGWLLELATEAKERRQPHKPEWILVVRDLEVALRSAPEQVADSRDKDSLGKSLAEFGSLEPSGQPAVTPAPETHSERVSLSLLPTSSPALRSQVIGDQKRLIDILKSQRFQIWLRDLTPAAYYGLAILIAGLLGLGAGVGCFLVGELLIGVVTNPPGLPALYFLYLWFLPGSLIAIILAVKFFPAARARRRELFPYPNSAIEELTAEFPEKFAEWGTRSLTESESVIAILRSEKKILARLEALEVWRDGGLISL